MSTCPHCGANGGAETGALADVLAFSSKAKPKANTRNLKARSYTYPGWEAFWQAYPLHRDKAKAYDAFLVAADVAPSVASLAEAAAQYARWVKVNRIETRHVKYAQGWLNDLRWEDEYDLPKPAGAVDYEAEKAARIAEEQRAIEEMS